MASQPQQHPWVTLYLSGAGLEAVATRFRASKQKVRTVLQQEGVIIRPASRPKDDSLPKHLPFQARPKSWCDQCQRMVVDAEWRNCTSQWCKV